MPIVLFMMAEPSVLHGKVFSTFIWGRKESTFALKGCSVPSFRHSAKVPQM
jgi:hypothetical protein